MRIAVLTLLVLALTAPVALANNTPDPRLDAVATEIAGHPVSVFCEPDEANWTQLVSVLAPTLQPDLTWGFNLSPDVHRIWLGPAPCLSLRYYLHDPQPASPVLNPRLGAPRSPPRVHVPDGRASGARDGL